LWRYSWLKRRREHVLWPCSPFFLFMFMGSFPWSRALRHKLTINVTRFNTHVHKHARRRMEELWKRNRPLSWIDVLFWRHLLEVKKSRITMLPWQTHAGNIIRISMINTFEIFHGILGLFLELSTAL
jgi:hypothetical protein